MLNLLFLTGNITKLVHARHIAEDYPIKIEDIKERTYNKSYSEPRLPLREILLEKSYQSALDQAKKTGWDTARDFFFLEDTSVRIDALSKKGMDVPGVDIKYWMQEYSFNDLDKILKESGNNRKVTVSSDTLLHIPDKYRKNHPHDGKYLVFTGKQDGAICDDEHSIKTNLVFPWLDNKTFNKWFVPDGVDVPISKLAIQQADKYDFRAKSLRKMLDFLHANNYLNASQQSMDFTDVSILIACGFTCAGKTTIAQYLAKNFDYIHIEASDFMHWQCYIRHGFNNNIKVADFAAEALKIKPHIVADEIINYIKYLPQMPIIISGFRSPKEIERINNSLSSREDNTVVVLEASPSIRQARYQYRENSSIDMKEIKSIDEQQSKMGLTDIMQKHSNNAIINEGSLDEFYKSFENKFLPKQVETCLENIDDSILKHVTNKIKFDEVIQITLLVWRECRSDNSYHTTAAIAKNCNEVFPKLLSRHKDNVSRYFNQNFYPFYEINPKSQDGKTRYRLSSTGYSKALLAYKRIRNNISRT